MPVNCIFITLIRLAVCLLEAAFFAFRNKRKEVKRQGRLRGTEAEKNITKNHWSYGPFFSYSCLTGWMGEETWGGGIEAGSSGHRQRLSFQLNESEEELTASDSARSRHQKLTLTH